MTQEQPKTLSWESFAPKFDESWHSKIKPIIESPEVYDIFQYLKQKSAQKVKIYPKSEHTFEAFKKCKYTDLKLVIIAIEPYAGDVNGIPQADGLCMSSSLTKKVQPSLSAFYDGIEQELYDGLNLSAVKGADLSYLAKQGVLLANYSLTVEAKKIGSHSNINLWLPFWKLLIENVFNQYNPGLIYLLLGKEAEKVEKFILPFNNYIFKCKLSSFYARTQQPWDSEGALKQINTILKQNNGIQIDFLDVVPF